MKQANDPKNKQNHKEKDTINGQTKTVYRKESKEEQDTVPIDNDAQKYFDAEDEDQELRKDDNKDIPL
ncbi:MAG: hypothetical protein ACTHOF_06925 [Flavisolibacter sp.]|jgi:hypothetical protein